MQLPTDPPFTSVRVKPIEGWTPEVVSGELPEPVTTPDGATVTVAPLSVMWTAEAGNEISQQEYQTFDISVGRLLSESGAVVTLPAVQSSTDGSVRAWDEPAAEGGEEPGSPAPAFTTTAAEGEETHGAAPVDTAGAESEKAEEEEAATGSTGTVASEPAASTASDGSNAAGRAGLVAGLLGLVAGVTALVRTRRA